MFGLANESYVLKKIEEAKHSSIVNALKPLTDRIEQLEDELANLEARIDELEKSYASGSIKRVEDEEPAVQVSPGFKRFSQRKREFELTHQKDGMTPTGRQIIANENQIRAAKEKK